LNCREVASRSTEPEMVAIRAVQVPDSREDGFAISGENLTAP